MMRTTENISRKIAQSMSEESKKKIENMKKES